jgi:predicted nucleic acid-binding protein
VIGSLGILLKAKEKGILLNIQQILELIDKTDFRVHPDVRNKVLHQAGEI